MAFNNAGRPKILRAITTDSTQVEMFIDGIAGRRLTLSGQAPAVRQDEGDQPNIAYPLPDVPPFVVSPNVPMDVTTATIHIVAKQRGTAYVSASIMKAMIGVNEANELSLVFLSDENQGEGGYPFEMENPGPFGPGVWKFVIDFVDQRIRIRVQDTAGSGIIDWKAAVDFAL